MSLPPPPLHQHIKTVPTFTTTITHHPSHHPSHHHLYHHLKQWLWKRPKPQFTIILVCLITTLTHQMTMMKDGAWGTYVLSPSQPPPLQNNKVMAASMARKEREKRGDDNDNDNDNGGSRHICVSSPRYDSFLLCYYYTNNIYKYSNDNGTTPSTPQEVTKGPQHPRERPKQSSGKWEQPCLGHTFLFFVFLY